MNVRLVQMMSRRANQALLTLSTLSLLAFADARAETVAACQKLALACQKQAGENDVMGRQCQRQMDACMNRARCEEAFYSCMELVELEETTEEACRLQHARCRGEQARQK